MADESKPAKFSNIVMVGALQSPGLFTCALLICSALLGANIWALLTARADADRRDREYSERFSREVDQIRDSLKEVSRETRILGVTVDNQNAIMLRRGVIRPEDIQAPTSGNHE